MKMGTYCFAVALMMGQPGTRFSRLIREGLRFFTPPIRSLSANIRQIPCSLQPLGADIEAGFNAKTGITETCDRILQPQPQKTCSSAAAQEY
jgi:hypothetical protein